MTFNTSKLINIIIEELNKNNIIKMYIYKYLLFVHSQVSNVSQIGYIIKKLCFMFI